MAKTSLWPYLCPSPSIYCTFNDTKFFYELKNIRLYGPKNLRNALLVLK